MPCHVIFVATLALVGAVAGIPSLQSVNRNTAQRIAEYNYPVETHTVHSEDGYILTLFRIPYSPSLQNQNAHRAAVLVQHGLITSSDGWILNGPDNSLPYLLADAGYDVWLTNVRGNTYSKQHETLSSSDPDFWNFSWHEMGLYDIPASIDYILNSANESALHYIGHSMGTTVFFVLMSLRPEYNEKVKTAHMLAPVAFTSHVTSISETVPGPLLARPSVLSEIIENVELLPHTTPTSWIGSITCGSPIQFVCFGVLFLMFGYSEHLNTTVLSDLLETHPAGTSSNTLLHFTQLYESGHFRWYDHGLEGNLQQYKQPSPPDYDVSKIVAPLWLYYSDGDNLADETDVKRLESLLPNVVETFHIPYPYWNHMDFLFALEEKEVIYDKVINAMNDFEEMGRQ